jgi:hypothetical protein
VRSKESWFRGLGTDVTLASIREAAGLIEKDTTVNQVFLKANIEYRIINVEYRSKVFFRFSKND